MGIVSDYLHALIARQVDEHRLVVWFDPDRYYADFACGLSLPDTTVARYDGSFFALRHEIEPLLGHDVAPRLVVYVPMSEEESAHALIALTTSGAVLKPGQNPMQRNTRSSVVVRWALRESLGQAKAGEVSKSVEAGKLSLVDADNVDATYGESPVVLSIFKTGQPQDVALALLGDDRLDEEIVARDALGEVAGVLGAAFGIDLSGVASCQELRDRLARHAITTEFMSSLHPPLPPTLETLRTATIAVSRDACVDLVRTWRVRRDLSESYAVHASRVEAALSLAAVPFTIDQIRDCETFGLVEETLQARTEVALTGEGEPPADLLDLARRRQSSYWSERTPEAQARWALVAVAGLLLAEARRIEAALKTAAIGDPVAILHAYCDGDRPWCLLDTHHRNMERRRHTFDFALDARHNTLEQLVARASQRYMEVGGSVAEHYVRALAAARFALAGMRRQVDVYTTHVRPALDAGKTAYVLVDALRFEMARELMESLRGDYTVEMAMAAATVPTITEIGMASLMPGAEGGGTLTAVGHGKLGLQVGDTVLRDRASRLNWLAARQPDPVAIVSMEEILPKPKRALHDAMKAARLIVVTSQEIDELCERDNIRLARTTMDAVLPDLARLAGKLRDLGCATIIVAADHGYLFGEEADSDMKIDPPSGGQTVDLHRRVWVGRGGSADPAFLRAPLSLFGLSEDLDIAVPWGFGVFKVQGGARAYFHGGMSPQEMAVPVLVLSPVSAALTPPVVASSWHLLPGSKRITTRFFSVQIAGQAPGLFGLEPSRARVEVRGVEKGKDGDVLSIPVSASYGFIDATGDVELRLTDDGHVDPNTVTLMITAPLAQATVAVLLLDAATGRELSRLSGIEMAITL